MIGYLGASYVPAGIQASPDAIRPDAKAAVCAAGADALPRLIKALSDDRWSVRAGAAEALSWLASAEAQSAIPALVPLLGDKAQLVRSQAADSLGLICKAALPTHAAAVRPVIAGPLRDALTNTNAFVRVAAARAILQADPADSAAMNELRRCVAEDPQTRGKTAQAKGGEEWQRWLADNSAQTEYGTSARKDAVRGAIKARASRFTRVAGTDRCDSRK